MSKKTDQLINDLSAAFDSDDEKAGKKALLGMCSHVLELFERAVDALEVVAKAHKEKSLLRE